MEMPDTSIVTDTAQQTGEGFFSVLGAWIFTPTGAVLTLLLLLIGGSSLVTKIIGGTSRLLSIAGVVTAALFFAWIVSGVLEGFGIPVREWIQSIAAQLPNLGQLFKEFIEKLLYTAI